MKTTPRLAGSAAVSLFLASTLGLAGCGEQKVSEVSGTIRYDGAPLEQGSIQFTPVSGSGPSGGGSIKDGKYVAKNLSPGLSKVSIRGTKITGSKKMEYESGPQVVTTGTEALPAKYNKETELTYEVKPGDQTKDFDLPK